MAILKTSARHASMAVLAALMMVLLIDPSPSSAQDRRIERAKDICQQYGFQAGTDNFANCVMQTEHKLKCDEERGSDVTSAMIGATAINAANWQKVPSFREQYYAIRTAKGCPAD